MSHDTRIGDGSKAGITLGKLQENLSVGIGRKPTQATLDALEASQRELEPVVTTLGEQFIVLPNVFRPVFFQESTVFTPTVVNETEPDHSFCEVGSGAGVTTILVARKCKNVTALDINPAAVTNTQANVYLHHLENKVTVKESDVFSALDSDTEFDVIYSTIPFEPVDPDTQLTMLERATFDPGGAMAAKLFNSARQHLRSGGKLLLGFSSTYGDFVAIQDLARQNGFDLVEIHREIVTDPDGDISLELYRAVA